MENIKLKVASTNWQEVAEEMHDKGFSLFQNF
jgi:hypothetical protein